MGTRNPAASRLWGMDDRSLVESALLDDEHSAEDAARDARLKLVGPLDRFQSGGSLEPWARRIAINAALDVRRARVSRNGATVRLHQEATPSLSAEQAERPMPGAVADAVRTLTEDRRVVVVLHYWLDLGVDEIAAILEIPRGTVMSRLHRAVDDLRVLIEGSTVEER